jgi:hypothetical protein
VDKNKPDVLFGGLDGTFSDSGCASAGRGRGIGQVTLGHKESMADQSGNIDIAGHVAGYSPPA